MALDWCTTGALVVLAAWLVWKYLSWNYGYWQSLRVPCLEPSVPFGNAKDMLLGKKFVGDTITDIYRLMEGQPFCGFYRLREPLLLVRDAELVRKMVVKDFSSFHDNNVNMNEDLDPILARNPFVLRGERWKKMRSQLTPSFTTSRMKPMYKLMKEVCDELVQMLEKEGPKANPDGLEAWRVCMRYTTDVVCSCAMGIKGGALEDDNSPMVKMFSSIFEPNWMSALRFLIVTTSPTLATLFRIRVISEEVDTFLRNVVLQTVARREHHGEYRNDYLQMLVELKTKGHLDNSGQVLTDKNSFSDVDIAAQVMTFLTDGTHTSATAMSFVLYELALNPEVQQRLRQELRKAVDKHGGQLGYDAVHECTYLDMVVSESLRLHPPIGHMEKQCTAAYALRTPSGHSFTLQPGTVVVFPISGLHCDPRYFPDPDTFNPERFSPDNKDPTSLQAFIPFGLGPRTCIGQRFALSQVKMGVASVVLNLEIRSTPRTPVPVQLDPKNFIASAKGGLWLGFSPLVN